MRRSTAKYPSSIAIYSAGTGRAAADPARFFVQTRPLPPTMQFMADQEATGRGNKRGARPGLNAGGATAFPIAATIAQAIVKFQPAEMAGFLAADDLCRLSFRPSTRPVQNVRSGGIKLYGCGARGARGQACSKRSNLLDGAELHKLGHNSTGYLHRVTEAVKLAFRGPRGPIFGDPRMGRRGRSMPLLSTDYAEGWRRPADPTGSRLAPRCRRPWRSAAPLPGATRRRLAGPGAMARNAPICRTGARHLPHSAPSTRDGQCVCRDAERRLLQCAPWCRGPRHHRVARRRQPETGGDPDHPVRPSRPASGPAAHPEPGNRHGARPRWRMAVRHAPGGERADAGDAAGVPQHPPCSAWDVQEARRSAARRRVPNSYPVIVRAA